MKRTQIYIREDQAKRIAERAADQGISKAEAIRRILDAAFETDVEADARSGILATAGLLPDAPDWATWQGSVRGRPAVTRLEVLEPPAVEDFDELLARARSAAEQVGLEKSEIARAVAKVRSTR
jgi:hypothetical protein